jgi:hypothetical protein
MGFTILLSVCPWGALLCGALVSPRAPGSGEPGGHLEHLDLAVLVLECSCAATSVRVLSFTFEKFDFGLV